MSSICGLISYNKKNFVIEDLIRLTHGNKLNSDERYLYTHNNKCGTFIGLAGQRRENSPNTIIYKGIRYTFVFDGVLHNTNELLQSIKGELGYLPIENGDFASMAAWAYILWGGFSPQKLFGKFVYVIYSEGIFDNSIYTPKLFLARDRSGIRPLYFTQKNQDEIIFSSNIRSILSHKRVDAVLDKYGLWQMSYLSGRAIPGKTLFKDIYELTPGACAYIDCRADGLRAVMQKTYFRLKPPSAHIIEPARLNKPMESIDFLEDTSEPQSAPAISDLDKCVEICEMPCFIPSFNILKSISNQANDTLIYSRIGADAFDFRQKGHIKSFFPWIYDPYEHIEYLNREAICACDGFNWLFDIFSQVKSACIFDENEEITEKRIKMCLGCYLNTPSELTLNEKIADFYSVNIEYPYASSEFFENVYYNLDNFNFGAQSNKANSHSEKNSELDRELKDSMKEILSNSEYEINNLVDKERVYKLICADDSSKSLQFLYLVHAWLEEFGVSVKV